MRKKNGRVNGKVNIVLSVLIMCVLTACNTIKSSPNNEPEKKARVAEINIQMGMAYLEQKNVQRAKQKFLTALDSAPSLPEAWYSMGYFLEVTGNKEEADFHYARAVSLAPQRGDTQNNYGTYLCRAGDYRGAIQHFKLAIQDPTYLDIAGAYENAGLCAMHIPDIKLAAQYFNQAISQDPHRPVSLINLAELNFKLGRYQAARENLDQYLLIAPSTSQALLLRKKLEH